MVMNEDESSFVQAQAKREKAEAEKVGPLAGPAHYGPQNLVGL